MGKYKASIGIWEHKLKGKDGKEVIHNIVPEEEDNVKFVEAKKAAAKVKDESILTKGISKLYYDMVIRSDSSLTDEDKKELKTWISLNINQITIDLMIAYNWTTQEKLDEMEKEQLKIELEVQKKKMILDREEEKQKALSDKR